MTSTVHRLINGDARDLSFLGDESVHLVVTSPPYWNLKRYNENPEQMGHIQDYEAFLRELEKAWRHVFRVLVPGGRLVCVVGDVCVARRAFGRHLVFPLHADICVICRRIGFDNLNPIIWHKIANASYEVANGSKFWVSPMNPTLSLRMIWNSSSCSGKREDTGSHLKLSEMPTGFQKTSLTVGFSRYGTSRGRQPSSTLPHFPWNWLPGW
jgi:hypothetical protein